MKLYRCPWCGEKGIRPALPPVRRRHFGEEDAYTAIEEDAQMIYKNFDAITMMMKSNEDGTIDSATSAAVKKFLRNIFEATVNIVTAYGLV